MRMLPVISCPGYYVTDDGRVFGKRKKFLKPSVKDKIPYLQVNIWADGNQVCKLVHRLVLEAFVGPCPEGQEVRHKDGNPQNNHVSNLHYGTRQDNIDDRIEHGTTLFGEIHGSAKLTEQDVRVIIYMYRTGLFTQNEIAEMYGLCRTTIGCILRRVSWRYIWTKIRWEEE